MTLVVLALDALDEALVDEFGVEELRLETSTKLESVAHVREEPYTPEVWATVATGLHPREHGVSTGTSTWDNPIVDTLSDYAGHLSMPLRNKLGNLITEATGAEYTIREVDAPTMFDGDDRVVHNWPGVARGSELKRAWNIMGREGQSEAAFERDILGLAAEQFGWAREMLRHDVSVAGVHIHLLDATGHAYCTQPEPLEASYRRAGEFVTEIRDSLGEDDELLILSDHGMVVDFYADEDDRGVPNGSHSWRAFASSTTDSVPESVFEVREWVDAHASVVTHRDDDLDIDMDQLRDLGYV
jgi:hypothetical protein